MKKGKMKALLSGLMAAVLLLSATACAKNPETDSQSGARPKGEKIVIYAGGSSEFSWVKGGAEAEVIEAIEQKYYDDTGISLDFEISFLDEQMTQKLTTEISGGGQVDLAVSHTRGGSGIDDVAMSNGGFGYVDISRRVKALAPNLVKHIDAYNYEKIDVTAMDALTTYDGKLVGIPSVISPYKFGILARKDYMDQLGYTTDESKTSEICPATNQNWELVDNLETFEEMCLAINTLTGQSYAVSGAPWDIEKVLTLGAFGVSGFFTETLYQPENGGKEVVVSGEGTAAYKEVLALEMRWAQNGVISRESQIIKVTQGESDFIAGNTGVFVLDPTVQHLIAVAKKTKAANADAEFVLLEPMRAYKDASACPKDENGEPLRGFMRNTEATFAAVIPSTSVNADKVLKFLNWVYANEDNYNMCRYGIEGAHWEKVGDDKYRYIGQDSKGNDYSITNPPYSGILTLVENQHISNLVYEGYTEEELSWIEFAKTEDFYIENNMIDYLIPSGGGEANIFNNIRNKLKDNVIFHAWKGGNEETGLLTGEDVRTQWQQYVDQYFIMDSEQRKYLERKAEYFKTMKNEREEKRADYAES